MVVVRHAGAESASETERDCLEALRDYDFARASRYLLQLRARFPPSSARLLRLQAAMLMAHEPHQPHQPHQPHEPHEPHAHHADALALLQACPEADSSAVGAMRVASALQPGGAGGAGGAVAAAVKQLVQHLEVWQRDADAWRALHELYLCAGEVARAAFCCEELVLHYPHHHLFHTRLADTRYTQRDLPGARAHYAHALRTQPACVRAALGLALAGGDARWLRARISRLYGAEGAALPLPLPAPPALRAQALPALLSALAL